MEAPEISAVQSVLTVQRKTPRMREAEILLAQRESAKREVEVEGREKERVVPQRLKRFPIPSSYHCI